jgi:hypothetical protein
LQYKHRHAKLNGKKIISEVIELPNACMKVINGVYHGGYKVFTREIFDTIYKEMEVELEPVDEECLIAELFDKFEDYCRITDMMLSNLSDMIVSLQVDVLNLQEEILALHKPKDENALLDDIYLPIADED